MSECKVDLRCGIIKNMSGIFARIAHYLRMIRFSHSVFALPFAFTGALIAASGIPTPRTIFWITLAMIGARSGAMGMNRIIDREIDRKNPRTRHREIPSGKIGTQEAVIFTVMALLLFIFAAYNLNVLAFTLSPLVILILFLYSYTKRFTWMSHFVLGIAISMAPLGAWIAVKGAFDTRIVPLVVAVVFWLAGFDILYALQDIDFDRNHGLYSIPQRFGIRKAIHLSRLFHAMTVLLLVYTGLLFGLGVFYWLGMSIVAFLFFYEHSLVKPDDLSKLDIAFFNMNGYISATVFVFSFLDYIVPLTSWL
jgi:4-hydroxybenzoate polyprenyltransferase